MTTNTAATTLTVTRALAEVKTLGSRINKAIDALLPVKVGVAQPQSPAIKAEQEEFCRKATADFQSVQDLILRRQALKSAILRSNAVTLVSINGEEMTVAEAIERKNSIALWQQLLRELKSSHRSANSQLEDARASFQGRLDRFIEGQEKVLKEPTLLAQATQSFTALHQPALLDPVGIEAQIAALEAQVEGFLLEVDFALSESNARTTISI